MRTCGGCTLCCKLLPMKRGADESLRNGDTVPAAVAAGLLTAEEALHTMRDFDKPAGERCKFQRHGKGCTAYSNRPFGCRFWNCRWLTADDTAELQRPDRTHYVIDISPDYVRTDDPKNPTLPVLQIWVDPDYPDAHKDPALRAYVERQADMGFAALVRLRGHEAFLLVPPSMTVDGQWLEKHSKVVEHEHTAADKAAVLGNMTIVLTNT
jgi:hypothetical protein